ncbi:unnamed protein product [Sympodiomycopsis kandeliae]
MASFTTLLRSKATIYISRSVCRRGFSTSLIQQSKDVPPHLGQLPHTQYAPQEPGMSIDHVVIGGGVVGLAIAASLARRYPDKSTFLLERHGQVGQETSSRNSEVIHGGMHYPPQSLKTQLCIRGREMMYERCLKWNVGHKMTGKLIVGPDSSKGFFEKMLAMKSQEHLGPYAPPMKLLSGDEARALEPDLGDQIGWAVSSPRTGIVSSHELMESLEKELQESDNAEIAYGTDVVRIDPHLPEQKASAAGSKRGIDGSQEGWVVQTVTDGLTSAGQSDSVLARVVINCSGLNSHLALNTLLAQDRFGQGTSEPMGMWFSKGNYLSYKGPGVKNVKQLIYPLPDMGPLSSTPRKGGSDGSHQGLGTHLTLDLDGNIRFGPDTEWLDPRDASKDPWKTQLQPVTSPERFEEMYQSITSYLPGVLKDGLSPDYAGIRPKLIPPGAGFMDFTPLWHYSRNLKEQRLWQYAKLPETFSSAQELFRKDSTFAKVGGAASDGGVMLTLAGIESPGLTSSLPLAEMIGDLITERVWGYGQAERQASNRNKSIPKGARDDEIGGASLDAWA